MVVPVEVAFTGDASVMEVILEPVEAKNLSASSANSRRSAALVPTFDVWAKWVWISSGSWRRKIFLNRKPGS